MLMNIFEIPGSNLYKNGKLLDTITERQQRNKNCARYNSFRWNIEKICFFF